MCQSFIEIWPSSLKIWHMAIIVPEPRHNIYLFTRHSVWGIFTSMGQFQIVSMRRFWHFIHSTSNSTSTRYAEKRPLTECTRLFLEGIRNFIFNNFASLQSYSTSNGVCKHHLTPGPVFTKNWKWGSGSGSSWKIHNNLLKNWLNVLKFALLIKEVRNYRFM